MSEQIEGFRISPQQRRRWLARRDGAGLPTAWVEVALRGPLDADRLEAALGEVVAAHEILRTRFVTLPGVGLPVQVVDEGERTPLARVDLADLEPAERDRRLERLSEAAAAPWSDPAAGPTVVATLARLAQDEHRLFLSLPTLAADRPTLDLVVDELARRLAGDAVEPPALHYADFAEWQIQMLESEETEAGREHWRTGADPRQLDARLDGAAPDADADSQGGAGIGLLRQPLTPALTEALEETARRRGAPAWVPVLAAFQHAVERRGGGPTVAVRLDGRSLEDLQGLLGPVSRTVPLALPADPGRTGAELVAELAAAVERAEEWQECFSWELVGASTGHAGGEASYPFAFEAVVESEPVAAGPLALEIVDGRAEIDHHDVELAWRRSTDGAVTLELAHDRSRVGRAAAERLLEGVVTLAAGLAGRLDTPLARLAAVGPAELSGQWKDLAGPPAPTPEEPTLHRWIARQAEETPDAPAVDAAADAGPVSYRELLSRARRLARHLKALGIGPGALVGVGLGRSADTVVAILASLECGAAYVPLDPSYPSDRLLWMLDDAGVSVLVTADRHPALAAAIATATADGPTTVLLDDPATASALDALPDGPLDGVPSDPDAPAYVLYTSGSTGRPKGVVVSHRNLASSVAARHAGYGRPVRRYVLASSFSFDSSVAGLYWTLTTGGCLALPPEQFQQDLDRFVTDLDGASHLLCLPSLYRLVLDRAAALSGEPLAGLETVIVAGEACPPDLVRRHFELRPDGELWNEYGPTEGTVWATVQRVEAGDGADGSSVPIGRPIAGARVRLLDAAGRVTPRGTAGEICLGGPGVARGYLGRPALTAERFVPDPTAPEDAAGARLYRTGDLGRLDAAGRIEFLGRADHQLKVRGVRIEPGEVEAALEALSAVREAVVDARVVGQGEPQLVAYVVAAADADEPDPSELRAALAERLPESMVPSHVHFLDQLPQTPNGKVDRGALPEPSPHRGRREIVAPANDDEVLLAALWSETLGVGEVGVEDSFFELGGDSIRSVRVRSRAAEAGIRFTVQQLFRHRTIRALLAAVEADGEADVPERVEPVAPFALVSDDDRRRLPADLDDAYPMAALQAGMLLHGELDAERATYHDIVGVHLEAPFDQEAMARSLDLLARRHPVLRTSFRPSGFSESLQLVHGRVEIPLTVTDARALSEDEQRALLARWMEEEKARPFDWRVAPLARVQVHLWGPERYQLTVSNHHAILDGWSSTSLFTELFETYRELLEGGDPELEPVPLGYADFIALERQALDSPESRDYWRRAVDGAELGRLPTWRPDPGDGEGDEPVRDLLVRFEPELLTALEGLARSVDVPLKTLALAGHLRVLSLVTGLDDVTTGMVSNGRVEAAAGEKVLGLFLNTIPLRHQLGRLGRGTWKDLIHAAFELEQEVLPHRRYPLAEIQRHAGGRTLFESIYNYVHFHVLDRLGEMDDRFRMKGSNQFEATNFPLDASFVTNTVDHRMSLRLRTSGEGEEAVDLERLADAYRRVFEAMVADPDGAYGRSALLAPEERRRVVDEWPEGPALAAGWGDGSWWRRIAEHAAATPERPAVVGDSWSLSYGELMERSDRVSAALAARGVAPEEPVGIALERGPWLLPALLGTLRSGAAYLPLDPAYPAHRLVAMVEDAGARRVLGRADELPWLEGCPGVEVVDPETAAGSTDGATPCRAPGSLAYVLYTSGSTGRPKGVAVSDGAFGAFLGSMVELLAADDADDDLALLAVTPLSFDISGLELWLPLVTGGRVELASREEAADGERLAARLAASGANLLQGTPATWRLLLEAGWEGGDELSALVGGEALPAELAVALAGRAARVWNVYGPTETAVWSSAHAVTGDEPAGWVGLGRPLAGERALVLDPWGQPSPVGVAGEIHLGGAGLARGYRGRPAATAERFVPDPLSDRPGERLYRTGDLGRWDGTGDGHGAGGRDGELHYLGRLDHQVKVRGHRIELGEIEAALADHPAVAEAVVTAWGETGEDRRLVAYWLGEPVEPAELIGHLEARLPPYMVPRFLPRLDAWPLTPSGKVDRRALPAPTVARGDGPPPEGPFEELVAEIWRDVLGVDALTTDQSFFELGGHSLLAMRVVARLRSILGVDLPMRHLFERPTLAGFVERVTADTGREHADSVALVYREVGELSDDELAELLSS